MISERNGRTILTPPLGEEDVRSLSVGREVYISGQVHVARDLAHKRMVEFFDKGEELPVDLAGAVVFHAGPIVSKCGEGPSDYEIVNIGPTTSARMNPNTPAVIARGVRAIVGKGAMDEASGESMKRRGACFLAAAAGCAMIHADCIRGLAEVHWLDLGTTEAIWVIDFEEWGPLTVAMDASGGNLFRDIRAGAEKQLAAMVERLESGEVAEIDTELMWD